VITGREHIQESLAVEFILSAREKPTVTVSDGERLFADELGRLARAQLPHVHWDEVEPHLMLGWKTSIQCRPPTMVDVRLYARESWGRHGGPVL